MNFNRIAFLISFFAVTGFAFFSCEKQIPEPPVDSQYATSSTGGNGPTTGGTTSGAPRTGNIMFWTSTDLGCGTITVTINGVSKMITSSFPSGKPSCGTSGCANYTLPEGLYLYQARCSGKTWGVTSQYGCGSIAGDCYDVQLTKSN